MLHHYLPSLLQSCVSNLKHFLRSRICPAASSSLVISFEIGGMKTLTWPVSSSPGSIQERVNREGGEGSGAHTFPRDLGRWRGPGGAEAGSQTPGE